MSRIDDLIGEALSNEDRELLERYGSEPGYFKQALSMFRGRLGWVMWTAMLVQTLFFIGGFYTLWQALTAEELLRALRWGLGAVVLIQLATFIRSFMGMHFEANRVLRELQRLELRLVRLEGGKRA